MKKISGIPSGAAAKVEYAAAGRQPLKKSVLYVSEIDPARILHKAFRIAVVIA